MTEVDRTRPTTWSLPPPPAASAIFGAGLPAATRYAELLAEHGVVRGVIGPREVDRLWERHLLNSAVIGELVPTGARVVDLGAGAGLPGVPLGIARPDLSVVLLDAMARRVDWLDWVVASLSLPMSVVRGRAEEPTIKRRVGGADVIVARAIAPLGKLCEWSLPLVRSGGKLVALKGTTAADELRRDHQQVIRAGGREPHIVTCGGDILSDPATVVVVERADGDRGRRTRKDR